MAASSVQNAMLSGPSVLFQPLSPFAPPMYQPKGRVWYAPLWQQHFRTKPEVKIVQVPVEGTHQWQYICWTVLYGVSKLVVEQADVSKLHFENILLEKQVRP